MMKKILLTISAPLITLLAIWSIPVIDAFRGTYYSPDFTKENFKKVEIGMTEGQVKELLGEPLSNKSHDGETHLLYSYTKNSGNYFLKVLILKDSKVIEKVEEIYID